MKPNLFSASKDGTCRFWNTMIGQETTDIGGFPFKNAPQLAIGISCEGSAAISAGADGVFRFLDIPNNDLLRGPKKALPLPAEPEEGWGEEGEPEQEYGPGDAITMKAHQAAIT